MNVRSRKHRSAMDTKDIYYRDVIIPEALAARDKEWVASTQPIIDSFIEFIRRGDYSNGNEAQGCDEGENLAAHHLRYLIGNWQHLKASMGVKE